jgi:membrane associated rhomboid family serine protease
VPGGVWYPRAKVAGPGSCLTRPLSARIFAFRGRRSHFRIDNKIGLRYSHDMRLSGRKPTFFAKRWTPRPRVALLILVGANVVAFVVQFFLQVYTPGLVHDCLGLSDRGVHSAYAWQFFTATFLHDGPWDLLGNTLILYLLGRDLELILGQRHFLFLYFAGIFGGELGHLFLMPSDCVLFAASGGVAAILVAYATVLPELELTSIVFFVLPLRLRAKYLAYGTLGIGFLLVIFDRGGAIVHSAYLGGGVAGWLYAHLLGFGRPSFFLRMLRKRQAEAERLKRLSPDQFMAEEIDPLLDKISRNGIASLTRNERRKLDQARERIAEQAESP